MDPCILLKVLAFHTQDADLLAESAEFLGCPEVAKEHRLAKLRSLIEAKAYGNALPYAKEHALLPAKEERELARKLGEAELETEPWKALELAREYSLTDLALKAAIKRSDNILANPGHDVRPALEIAEKERAENQDFRRCAARAAYTQFIRMRSFGELRGLVNEFQEFFTDGEKELAEWLCEMAVKKLAGLNKEVMSSAAHLK